LREKKIQILMTNLLELAHLKVKLLLKVTKYEYEFKSFRKLNIIFYKGSFFIYTLYISYIEEFL